MESHELLRFAGTWLIQSFDDGGIARIVGEGHRVDVVVVSLADQHVHRLIGQQGRPAIVGQRYAGGGAKNAERRARQELGRVTDDGEDVVARRTQHVAVVDEAHDHVLHELGVDADAVVLRVLRPVHDAQVADVAQRVRVEQRRLGQLAVHLQDNGSRNIQWQTKP